jgi:hypothetical protein
MNEHNNLHRKMLLFVFVPQKIDSKMVFISLSSRYLFEFTIFFQMKIGIDFMPMGLFLTSKCSKNGKTDKCNSLCHRVLPTVKHSLPVKIFSAREKIA